MESIDDHSSLVSATLHSQMHSNQILTAELRQADAIPWEINGDAWRYMEMREVWSTTPFTRFIETPMIQNDFKLFNFAIIYLEYSYFGKWQSILFLLVYYYFYYLLLSFLKVDF